MAEKPKEWEEAWSPNKIRQNAADWNLAGDAGLLLHLRQASSGLMSRLDNTKRTMNDLADEAQKTVVRLDNTINDFSRLANNQFIENRVYDDDVKPNRDVKPKQELAKTKEEREVEMVSAMKSALEMGCSILDSHFTKIDVRSLDFDEDDDPSFNPQPVFEPKDLYNNRPLPYIIATVDFMRSDFIGLREDEDELQISKKQESLSESDDETAVPAEVPSTKPMEQQQPTTMPHVPSAAKDIVGAISPSAEEKAASDSSSSGLFGTSPDSGDNVFPGAAATAHADQNIGQGPKNLESDFRSELTKKLTGSVPGAVQLSKEKPKPSGPAAQSAVPDPRADNDDDDILFSPPPLLPRQQRPDDSDDEGGLFKPRTRGLFDDDEDEDTKPPPLPRARLEQMANAAKVPTVIKSDNQSTERQQPLRTDLIVAPSAAVPASSPAPTSNISTATKPKAVSMFADDDNDENEDDDLFGTAYKKSVQAPKPTLSSTTRSNIDDLSKKADALPRPILPIGGGLGASLFGDDDDEEDDLFAVLKRPKQSGAKPQSLFGESADTVIKGQAITDTKLPAEVAHSSPLVQEAKPNFTPAPKLASVQDSVSKPAHESLFSRSPTPPPAVPTASQPKKEATSVTANKSSGLFGDDSDDDSLFPKSAAVGNPVVVEEKTEESVQKMDFRAELSKKLMAGPQSGGFIKPTQIAESNEQNAREASQSHLSAKASPSPDRNGIDVHDEDLFRPPAHGLFGNDSNDQIDEVPNFDAATKVETLPTLHKNRAKLPNRRPPTKHSPVVPVEQQSKVESKTSPVPEKPVTESFNNRSSVNADPPVLEKPIAESFSNQGSINADPLGVESSSILASSSESPPMKVSDNATTLEKSIVEKRDNLVSKSKAAAVLFNDNDDDDLFGKIDKTLQKSVVTKPVRESKKPESESTGAGNVQEPKKPTPSATSELTRASKGDGGLFSDDDEDDLFSDTKRPAVKKAVQPAPDEDIFASLKTSDSSNKKTVSTSTPAPASSQSNKKGKSLFDDDDDDNDIFR